MLQLSLVLIKVIYFQMLRQLLFTAQSYSSSLSPVEFNVVNENQKSKFSYGAGTIIPQHRPVRASFDSLLDFFCELEYLLGIGLIKCEELSYFKYYIDRAANNDSIVNYTLMYEFPLNGKLNRNLLINAT